MKITDYAILFLGIILSFCIIYEFKDQMAFKKIICDEEINKAVDNSVVMALKSGYTKDIDNKCEIDLEITKNVLRKSLSEMLYGDIKEYHKDGIIACILVDGDGYYTLINNKWSDKNIFGSSSHSGKVQEIEEVLEEKLDNYIYRILLPENSGEIFAQTISDYSLLVVYETQRIVYDDVIYSGCILSGAAIK
ncbi:MAG: hypothetical protein SOV90_04915 [Lachnospiraceae bacterium]|nr:hypothetical protein [Clostridiales bacterium]MDD6293486.1 hypothetical protein [Eubacteriales bacterium]MDY2607248.1 hypothetical protein [Lachnospiraceae bacterium]